ncbi:MYXO-CTERM sorting domain-containing protein [Streptomyces sp. NPDC012508]
MCGCTGKGPAQGAGPFPGMAYAGQFARRRATS